MNDTIVNGLFTITGGLIGFAGTFFTTRNSRLMAKLESLISKLAEQVASYWELEKLYSEEVSRLSNKNASTILRDYREKVVKNGRERPTMTAAEADGIVKRHSL